MSRARKNPRGYPVSGDSIVVTVGERGKRTHLYDPADGDILCKSGKNAGRYPSGGDRAAIFRQRRDSSAPREFFKAYAYEYDEDGNRKRPPVWERRSGVRPKGKPAKVTCYRCAKLAAINVAAGRKSWEGPDGS